MLTIGTSAATTEREHTMSVSTNTASTTNGAAPAKPIGKVLPNLAAENEALKAQIAAMQAAALLKVYFKVSDKGAVSVYGLQRFPVTLYRDQWATLLDRADDIKAFITANDKTLKLKA